MRPTDAELEAATAAIVRLHGPQGPVRESWVERRGRETQVHLVFGEPERTERGDRYRTWVVTLRPHREPEVEALTSLACSPR